MQCVNWSASWTSWIDQLDGPAGWTSWTDQLDGPAGRTSWTDQLDGPAGRTSWTDHFSLLEALASSHIRRLTFQFVPCRSFRVRQRPCFSHWNIWLCTWGDTIHKNSPFFVSLGIINPLNSIMFRKMALFSHSKAWKCPKFVCWPIDLLLVHLSLIANKNKPVAY